VLQCDAVRCSVLHCVAMCVGSDVVGVCQQKSRGVQFVAVVAVCCNVSR